jgi:hypothetical protein
MYDVCNEQESEKDLFREYEKRFKLKIEQKSKLQKFENERFVNLLQEVNDLYSYNSDSIFEKVQFKKFNKSMKGVLPPEEWEAYTLKDFPGFYFIVLQKYLNLEKSIYKTKISFKMVKKMFGR